MFTDLGLKRLDEVMARKLRSRDVLSTAGFTFEFYEGALIVMLLPFTARELNSAALACANYRHMATFFGQMG